MKKNLKIVLIGAAGKQGQEYYSLLKNEFHITSAVDPSLNRLSMIYKDQGLSLYDSIETTLQNEDFQVAIVCVPHGFHHAVTLPLLKNGKLVIKEKPLALSVSEIQDYKAISNSNVFTIVQRQFNPVFSGAKTVLPLLGTIYSYKYEYALNILNSSSDWRSSPVMAGGGILTDMGYHVIDMVLSFFGSPSSFSGNFSYCYEETAQNKLEDSVSLILVHDHGRIMGNIYLNKHHSHKKEEFQIIGSEGTMMITPNFYQVFNRKGILIQEFKLQSSSDDAKKAMFHQYIQSEHNNAYYLAHLSHHEAAVTLIENIYQSKKQRVVS